EWFEQRSLQSLLCVKGLVKRLGHTTNVLRSRPRSIALHCKTTVARCLSHLLSRRRDLPGPAAFGELRLIRDDSPPLTGPVDRDIRAIDGPRGRLNRCSPVARRG